MARILSSAFGLLLCMSLLSEAQGQKKEPPSISVRSLDAVKLVNEKHQPVEIEERVRLQTSGTAISSLRVFYRRSADAPFQESRCELLPNLQYYVRLPYSPLIEYYFVATPLRGNRIKFGEGTMMGSDLESRGWTQEGPMAPYVAAAGAGIIATVVSVLVNSDQPAVTGSVRSGRNGAALYVGVGALVGGVTASVIYLRNRHKRRKEYLGGNPSERLSGVP